MSASIAYQTIGMLGSFVISSALVPQMYKVYKTKSAKDISMTFQTLYIGGVAMILIYGFGEGLWPIYIPALLEELAAVIMLGMKLFFDRRAKKLGTSEDTESPEIGMELELGLGDRSAPRNTATFGEVRTPR